jgi:metal-responsive CopG/Arc/MetJ family transcriptional regulator
MSRKSEIKVYLPIKMIGELESRKRAGERSKFIETAIRNRLNKFEDLTLKDVTTKALVAELYNREINSALSAILALALEGKL